MMDRAPAKRLEFEEFWLLDEEERRDRYGVLYTEKAQKVIVTNYAKQRLLFRNYRCWSKCEKAGFSPPDFVPYIDLNVDRCRSNLKARKFAEHELWIILSVAGFDAAQEMSQAPSALEHLDIVSLRVEDIWQKQVIAGSPSSAIRTPVEHHSRPHAALMTVLFQDPNRRKDWINLVVNYAYSLETADRSPPLVKVMTELYADAAKMVAADSDAVAALEDWSPERGGMAVALGRFAQAWNPYQLQWYFSCEAIHELEW
ncbi:hypothetical protein [Blastopirellula marina]|uniref:Uncharacterized protein n=1 Tax=Blastopirellula marina DSM 3645 TaxID=314230 RepID=A3ZMU7_9BACT|nr:hypothetical protein [Blastopirellula marina]EAQ82273.1 hypothetical protein DSM3645_01125 [Blastopirellula marina DSM 3645]